MRLAILPLIACLVAGCSTPPAPPVVVIDPIDQLVAKFSTMHGMWDTGTFNGIKLPETAPAEDVIQRIFSIGLLQPISYDILQIRRVHIPNTVNELELCTAALVRTESGEKIVLFKYEGPVIGWWFRTYDAKTLGVTPPWS